MPSLPMLWRRLRTRFRRDALGRELDEEMGAHIELETEDLMRRGVPPDEARRQALVAFGGLDRFKEEGRDVRGVPWLEALVRDLRFALRSLRRTPLVALLAILILATGIGMTTISFSILYGGYLRGLPYPDNDRLVIVRRVDDHSGQYRGSTGADLAALQAGQHSFVGLAASAQISVNAVGPDATERFRGSAITANTFSLLGVRPILGRDFGPADQEAGAPPVVLLSHRIWAASFGADSSVLGRSIRLNGVQHTVVGVMPPNFRFPQNDQLWTTLRINSNEIEMDPAQLSYRGRQLLRIWGRLAPGATLQSAQAEADGITRGLLQQATGKPAEAGAAVFPLKDSYVKAFERDLVKTMVGAVFCVLLIACANVANLLLDRAIHRTREVGIRRALGASRSSVIRQFLVEAFLLATAGAVTGVVATVLALRALRASQFINWLPFFADVQLYWPVLWFAAGLALAATLTAGAMPAWQSRRVDVNAVLKGDRADSSAFRVGRSSRILVIGEIALSLLLAVTAGLMIKSIVRASTMDPGFRIEGIFVASVRFPPGDTNTGRQRLFYQAVRERLAAMPGVEVAALSAPLPGVYQTGDYVKLEGVSYQEDDDARWVFTQRVTPDLFRAFEIPLLRGRGVSEEDGPSAPAVVVVSEDFAARFFPGKDPIGHRIQLGEVESHQPWLTIVGVVGSTYAGLTQDPHRDRLFLPLAQMHMDDVSIALRTTGDPRSLVPAVRRVVAQLDPDLSIASSAAEGFAMEDVLAAEMLPIRMFARLFMALGGVALLMDFAGLYGVMSCAVSRRTREMGIRMALGADAKRIARTILGDGLVQIGIGISIGLLLAGASVRTLRFLLFEVQPGDPLVFLIAALLLLLAGVAACWVPMRRATRVDPVVVLRAE